MNELANNVLMTLALGGLAVSGLLFASALLYPYLRDAWNAATALARAVFCGAVVIACLFGGAKNRASKFTFADGLKDNGSYTTNDTVHIAWTTTTTIPATNNVFIESILQTNTSGTYAELASSAVGAMSWTGTLPDATNYDFNVWYDYIEPVRPVPVRPVNDIIMFWTSNTEVLEDTFFESRWFQLSFYRNIRFVNGIKYYIVNESEENQNQTDEHNNE